MALPMKLVVGMLMLSGVQASDIADGFTNHGFLSKYMHSPFATYSDKPVHAKAHTQDTMDFSSARPGAFKTSKNFKVQMIADKKEDADVQKLRSTERNKPTQYRISAIVVAVALL